MITRKYCLTTLLVAATSLSIALPVLAQTAPIPQRADFGPEGTPMTVESNIGLHESAANK